MEPRHSQGFSPHSSLAQAVSLQGLAVERSAPWFLPPHKTQALASRSTVSSLLFIWGEGWLNGFLLLLMSSVCSAFPRLCNQLPVLHFHSFKNVKLCLFFCLNPDGYKTRHRKNAVNNVSNQQEIVRGSWTVKQVNSCSKTAICVLQFPYNYMINLHFCAILIKWTQLILEEKNIEWIHVSGITVQLIIHVMSSKIAMLIITMIRCI